MNSTSRKSKSRWAAALAFLLALIGVGSAHAANRYKLVRDPGSSWGRENMFDRETKQWVYRECEVRVKLDRKLPDPIRHPDYGDQLTIQHMTPESAKSSGLVSIEPEIRDGYRVWKIREHLEKADLRGTVSYGVGVTWPVEGKPSIHDPFEVFELPPLGATPPDQWSPWVPPTNFRAGAMGWWEHVHQQPGETVQRVRYPFELRFRLRLIDRPGVPP